MCQVVEEYANEVAKEVAKETAEKVAKETALELMKKGMNDEFIHDITKLSMEEIHTLRNID